MSGDRRGQLYDSAAARALRERESRWKKAAEVKFALLLEKLKSAQRVLDIGCGWGQFIEYARAHIPKLWGLDESAFRLADARQRLEVARLVIGKANYLPLADKSFDGIVMSQTLHEIKLFGAEAELDGALRECWRILQPDGRYLLLDHQDAGDGEVVVRLPQGVRDALSSFESRFCFYRAAHEDMDDGRIRISKRCLQDFLTKEWALDSPMEQIEMNETHNVFETTETVRVLHEAGFEVLEWTSFSSIVDDLELAGGELIEGVPWFRKFLCIATRSG